MLLVDPPLSRCEVASLPAPVRAFIVRRAGCNHWGGEDAYEAARGRDIRRALRELRCDTIDRDERVVRARFAHEHAILRAISGAREFDGAI